KRPGKAGPGVHRLECATDEEGRRECRLGMQMDPVTVSHTLEGQPPVLPGLRHVTIHERNPCAPSSVLVSGNVAPKRALAQVSKRSSASRAVARSGTGAGCAARGGPASPWREGTGSGAATLPCAEGAGSAGAGALPSCRKKSLANAGL